ncbi:alpha/beta hydrolase family protein [Paenibacillus tundrae]|uniref:Dienelactone hydrolase n=1 Tax=Paenibacillus tundrae TaxID=528187 RepID=A0ABT9WK06_9BACL|nr:MFS transporter [Paenibacillus tundrae]MDQ0173591.1 dienelactone hydrolase [Paenibacillus tundrae]
MENAGVSAEETTKKRPLFSIKKKRIPSLTPGWKGAVAALSIVTLSLYFVQAYYYLGSRGASDYWIGSLLFLFATLAFTGILAGLLHWVKKLPSRYVWSMLTSLLLLLISLLGPIPLTLLVTVCILIACSVLGALLYRFISGVYREARTWKKVRAAASAAITLIFVCMLGYWIFSEGQKEFAAPYPLQTVKPAEAYTTLLTNPAEPGTFSVKSLTYGSHSTYRDDLSTEMMLTTKSVDGSAFVGDWTKRRTSTFGFGAGAMPLNGTVWYPEGDGPFPLVLIVHGNHLATKYSDPGYAYLGELLASRGHIVVSIDENFLNSSPFNELFVFKPLQGENRARGWLLLEHLMVWEGWNNARDNPFYNKVDMEKIALIGHSRGAEAVTTAAAYNKMTSYPENANIKFDYNFNIRSIVSIAGTDGQYKPAGQPMSLKDVNYLALHGTHDMDVTSFVGTSQYHRTEFTDRSSEFFKSYVYIYGANHGQFNTEWGKHDGVGLGNKLFNTAGLLPQDQQLQAAKVLISSFLEATLQENTSYQMVFQDLGYARDWLPETMYISNYWDANTLTISSYDEDSDPGTTTLPGGSLEGEGLKTWKEQNVEMGHTTDPYNAVALEWDQTATSSTPVYRVILPDQGIGITDQSSIVFSIANTETDQDVDGADLPVDLTVAVEDDLGNTSRLPLSSVSPLLPMFEGALAKSPFALFQTTKEPVFQNYAFQLADFVAMNRDLNPEQIRNISFVFDQSEKGSIMIRDIGIQ